VISPEINVVEFFLLTCRLNILFKSKFKIDYRVSGEAFLTKPNKTTFMIQDVIKKISKLIYKNKVFILNPYKYVSCY